MNRNYSLKKNKEFSYVYRRGKSVANKNLVLYFVKKKTNGLKVGFCVTKKVGNAVVRNKIKRRLKASFDILFDNIEKNTLIIFVARPNITELSYPEINKNMEHVLKKARLFVDE